MVSDWLADTLCLAGIIILIIILSACTTANVKLPDGTQVSFTRSWTDAYVAVDQNGMVYSSSPSAAAQQATIDVLLKALGTLASDRQSRLPARLHASEAGL